MHPSRFIWGLTTVSLLAIATPATLAIQSPSGRVFFEKSPRLTRVFSTFDSVRVWHSTYYFTIELPENAGEPLETVTIQQREGQEQIRFRLEDTVAFLSNNNHKGEKLAISSIIQNEETKAISVILDSPVSPGQQVTIGLKPRRNPSYSGVYLFGVTVFPVGETMEGLYLGVGRLHFYNHWDY